MGAAKVIVCDIKQSRLDFIESIMPGCITLDTTGLLTEDIVLMIRAAIGGDGWADSSIDCSGAVQAVQASILVTLSGGVVCLVGMGCADMSLPILNASVREVELQGVFRYRNTYPKCLDMLKNKQIDVSKLITHRYEFTNDSILDAFDACRTGKGKDGKSAIKCMIKIA